MATSRDTRRENLRLLVGQQSQADFARELEVEPAYISQLLTGDRNIGDRTARKLEAMRGLPEGWMDQPHPRAVHEPNVEYANQEASLLPLISWVSAGMKDDANDPYAPGNAEAWIPFESQSSSSAFCLRVRGESMIRPDGTGFPDGCLIAVEPKRRPKSGDFAVFRFNDSDEATFKMYVSDGPLKMLRPLNPSYPVIALGPDAQLVGTVFEMRTVAKF